MSQRFQNPFGDEMQTSGRRRRRPRVHTQGISRKRTARCVFRRDVGMRPEIAVVVAHTCSTGWSLQQLEGRFLDDENVQPGIAVIRDH